MGRMGETAMQSEAAESGMSRAGRTRGLARKPVLWGIALAVGALVAGGVWPEGLPADAEPRQVKQL